MWANIYQKNTSFGDFGGCKPVCFKLQRWILAWGCGLGTPQAKFGKKSLKGCHS